jgi:biopolymer transport protein ExbD
MPRKRSRQSTEVNAGSMADIAFLLLIFFLVTTTMASDKGLMIILPPKPDPNVPPPDISKNQRNIFKILANSKDQLLVEDEPFENVRELRKKVKEFVLNYGKNPKLSDSPEEAVVSFKSDRGTSYETYISVLDELQGAYYEIYAEKVGLTPEQYRKLDRKNPKELELYNKGKEGIPMNISIAEPTNIGGGK